MPSCSREGEGKSECFSVLSVLSAFAQPHRTHRWNRQVWSVVFVIFFCFCVACLSLNVYVLFISNIFLSVIYSLKNSTHSGKKKPEKKTRHLLTDLPLPPELPGSTLGSPQSPTEDKKSAMLRRRPKYVITPLWCKNSCFVFTGLGCKLSPYPSSRGSFVVLQLVSIYKSL